MRDSAAPPAIETTKTKAQLWEEGCQRCDLRNNFVIPQVAHLMEKYCGTRVIDVGAGTGYIARRVDALVSSRPEWTLIDLDPARLEVAKYSKPEGMRQELVLADFVDQYEPMERFDLCLVTFTLLEIVDVASFLNKLVSCLVDGGSLVVAAPDNAEDAYRDFASDPEKFDAFLAGSVMLQKIDKFTGDAYPFRALRTERLIEMALSAGFELKDLAYNNEKGARAYILGFQLRKLPRHG